MNKQPKLNYYEPFYSCHPYFKSYWRHFYLWIYLFNVKLELCRGGEGWLCKTWEGELAMVSMPGTMSEKFLFSVRDDRVANKINANMGRKVAMQYEQHVG